jgi:hypothetical protein
MNCKEANGIGSSLWASFTTPASIFRWERANMPGKKRNNMNKYSFRVIISRQI